MDARPRDNHVATFPDIADYSAVGNLETVAMIARTGAVELFSYPRFDSPTIFAAALDRDAGHFTIRPSFAVRGTPRYIDGTNVLVTRFESGDGAIVELTDFMPIGGPDEANQLVRIAAVVEGEAQIRATCRPAFDYGRGPTTARLAGHHVRFEDGAVTLPMRLASSHPLSLDGTEAGVTANLRAGERLVMVLVMDDARANLLKEGKVDEALQRTIAYWRDWSSRARYDGPWREAVVRSALALKLMFSDRHGAMVAAPTFGLPEAIGGERNWDYRYCWVRDSAFTIYAMLRLGYREEADKYALWIRDRVEERAEEPIALMYRVDGTTDLEEQELTHLSGYRNSAPVRIGNAAYQQTQLDIFGEVVDTLYLAEKALDREITVRSWRAFSRLVDSACASWDQPGAGFWEMRGPPQRFLDAHLMAWVALDRALLLADATGHTPKPAWSRTREAIASAIETEFYNSDIGAYVQTAGGDRVDAVALLMPLMKYTLPTEPRFASTLTVIENRLVEGARVRRYEPIGSIQEGVDGPPEGAFLACSFWYVEVLARASRLDDAVALFEELVGYSSPTGLLSEEVGLDGQHLGNTPQALSHLALISAAVAIERARNNGGRPF